MMVSLSSERYGHKDSKSIGDQAPVSVQDVSSSVVCASGAIV